MKITLAQLDAHQAFHGDADGWARSTQRTSDPTAGRHWPLIDELLMGLSLVARGQTAPAYREALLARIETSCANAAVKEKLLALAGARQGGSH